MFNSEVCELLISVVALFALYKLFKKVLLPIIINATTKEIEVNPKWIASKVKNEYGFSDIDFVIVESPIGVTPRFRITKNDKFQLLLSEDTSVNDVDELIRIALVGKVKARYGLWFPDKPTYWLSVLCFMLDGGDIRMESTKWKDKNDKKPIDL